MFLNSKVTEFKYPGSVNVYTWQGPLNLNGINMNRETFNSQLTSEVVTFQVENYYKLKSHKER